MDQSPHFDKAILVTNYLHPMMGSADRRTDRGTPPILKHFTAEKR